VEALVVLAGGSGPPFFTTRLRHRCLQVPAGQPQRHDAKPFFNSVLRPPPAAADDWSPGRGTAGATSAPPLCKIYWLQDGHRADDRGMCHFCLRVRDWGCRHHSNTCVATARRSVGSSCQRQCVMRHPLPWVAWHLYGRQLRARHQRARFH